MSWTRRDWLFCLILAAVTILAYHDAWHGGLLWDDDNCTTPRELRSLDGLRRIWFQPMATAQYYPLLYSSYWIQQRLWGDSTTGYHFINLLLHIGCVVLVLKILRFLRIPGAELAAMIFALHPVNVETVAWISERKNTLSGIFALAATLWYLRFDERGTRRAYGMGYGGLETAAPSNFGESESKGEKDGPQGRGYTGYVFAIGFFILGLLSKTAIATVPLAWLVIVWWKRGSIRWRRDVIPVAPFLFLSSAAGMVTRWFENTGIGDKARVLDFSLLDRCLIAGRAFWFQLSKLLWPSDLTFVYPRWNINAGVWWQYLFPIGVLVLLIILWSARRWSRAPLAGVLIYLFLLLPSLGFLNIYFFVYSFVADHWQYLACLGIITPCASGVVLLAQRMRWESWLEPAATLVIGGALFVLTSHQSRMYGDIETLYRTTIARNPGCWMAQVNLGWLLYKANRIPEATDLFDQALRIKPAVGHYSLGNALALTGKTSGAIAQYEQALRIDPDFVEVHNNLGSALMLTGRTSEAIDQFEQALRINPYSAEAHSGLGSAFVYTGRASEAIDHYKKALRMTPTSTSAHNNMGTALAQMGRISQAVAEFKAALRLNPLDIDARNNLTKLEALQKTASPKK